MAINLIPNSLNNLILNGGDFNINFGRLLKSTNYYDRAWQIFYNKDSRYVLRRTLRTYMKMNAIGAKENNFYNGKLSEIPGLTLLPFTSYNPEQGEKASFKKPSSSRISEVISRIKNRLMEYFELGNVNVIFDFTRMGNTSNKNLKIYFDKIYTNYDTDLIPDPLDYTKRNGNIKFVSPKGIMMTLVIPVEFLEDLAFKHLKTISNATNSQVRPQDYDILWGEKRESFLSMDGFNQDFLKVFHQVFTIALYRDRFRENLYAQIYAILNIFKKEVAFEAGNIKLSTKALTDKFIQKYYRYLRTFGIENTASRPDDVSKIDVLSPSYVDIFTDIFKYEDIILCNPIDFYNTFCELPSYECSLLSVKLGFSPVINGVEYVRFASSLYELNKNMNDRYSNAVVSSILMKRLIPIILLSEFIIGKGSKEIVVRDILDKMRHQNSRLASRANDYVYSTNLTKVIENIDYDLSASKVIINVLIRNRLLPELLQKIYCESQDENLATLNDSDEAKAVPIDA